MTDTDGQHIKSSIEDEAVAWHVRLTSGTCSDDDITRHMEWMLADPKNLSAYEKVAAAYHALGKSEDTIRAAFPNEGIQLSAADKSTPWYAKIFEGWNWPQTVSATAAAIALLFFATGTQNPFYDDRASSQYYTSTSDEVRTVKLADGSRVSMFANTKLSVAFETGERTIDLLEGRAFFDVVSDSGRPFYVNTGNRQIKVVGTRFEVVRAQNFDRVSVNEGLVSVQSIVDSDMTTAPLLIEPGVSALYELDSEQPILTEVSTDSVGSWKEGVLAFQNTPLIDVVTEIGQLFPETTISVDASIEGELFSGTLVISDAVTMTGQLARFLSLKNSVNDAHIAIQPQ